MLASLYNSPGSNFRGQPVAGLGNLMPSIPSLAGSHQVSCTWSASVFTPGPSSPQLTVNQANSLYKLAAECQALGIKLAKKFQVLSGLEAMYRNSIQGTVHETLTLGPGRPLTLPSYGTESLTMNVRPQSSISAQRPMSLGRRCIK